MIKFTELQNGNLRLTLSEDGTKYYDEAVQIIQNNSAISALLTLTEYYWTNGWGVLEADELHQMSQAPVIVQDYTIEDDGSRTLYGKAWYYPNYMILNPLEEILKEGYVDFTLWEDFQESVTFSSL